MRSSGACKTAVWTRCCGWRMPPCERSRCWARVTIPVPQAHGQPARTATVAMRALPTTLQLDRVKYPHPWPLTWTLVEVWEPSPAPACEALHWLLWTREAATTLAEMQEVVRKYTGRWPIEAYHVTRKSDCRMEGIRLAKWDRLEKAIVDIPQRGGTDCGVAGRGPADTGRASHSVAA